MAVVNEPVWDRVRECWLAEPELKTATTTYYYMNHLASLDETRGHPDEAVAWMKRAYEESRGPATRFRRGTNYVASLIRNRPTNAAAIRQATLFVLGELGSVDDLHGSNSARLQRLSNTLQKWNSDGRQAKYSGPHGIA